jgi:hypothetical protein
MEAMRMPGLPKTTGLRHGILVLTLASLALTGCADESPAPVPAESGPTAAQAGRTLKQHILQLLKERNAQHVTITDPGGKNIPCADGKAKQTFAATGADLESRTAPDALNEMLLGALRRIGDYVITGEGEGGDVIRVSDQSTETFLILSSRDAGQYLVVGETGCLRLS